MSGQQVVDIYGKQIDGLKTSDIMSDIMNLLMDSTLCVAGGYVLDAVSLKPYGKDEATDIDFWLLDKRSDLSYQDTVQKIIDWCECDIKNITIRGPIMYMKHTKYNKDVQIMNTNYKSLDEIITSFDNPASQIGIQVGQTTRLLCTEDFLECMRTGIINWWNFDRGQLYRLSKYKTAKRFKLASYLQLLSTQSGELQKVVTGEPFPMIGEGGDRSQFINWTKTTLGCSYQNYSFTINGLNPRPKRVTLGQWNGRFCNFSGVYDTGVCEFWEYASFCGSKLSLSIQISEEFAHYIDDLKHTVCIPYIKDQKLYKSNIGSGVLEDDFNSIRCLRDGTYWIRVKIYDDTFIVSKDGTSKSLEELSKTTSATHQMRILGRFSLYKYSVIGMKLNANVIYISDSVPL